MTQGRFDVVIGYVLAVLAASVVWATVYAVAAFFSGHASGVDSLKLLVKLNIYFGCIVAATAWPGFIVTHLAREIVGRNSLAYFAMSGIATAYSAVIFAAITFWSNDAFFLMYQPTLYLSGAAGGLVYGLYVKRHLMVGKA